MRLRGRLGSMTDGMAHIRGAAVGVLASVLGLQIKTSSFL
jgi:hypothetical protein